MDIAIWIRSPEEVSNISETNVSFFLTFASICPTAPKLAHVPGRTGSPCGRLVGPHSSYPIQLPRPVSTPGVLGPLPVLCEWSKPAGPGATPASHRGSCGRRGAMLEDCGDVLRPGGRRPSRAAAGAPGGTAPPGGGGGGNANSSSPEVTTQSCSGSTPPPPPVAVPPPRFLSSSFFHFIRRFWNQILMCLSVKFSITASSTRRGREMYLLKRNSFSSSSSCARV